MKGFFGPPEHPGEAPADAEASLSWLPRKPASRTSQKRYQVTDNKRLTRLWPRAGTARLRPQPGGRNRNGAIRQAALAGVLVVCTAGGPNPLALPGTADRGPAQDTAGADGHAPLNLVPPPSRPAAAAGPAAPASTGGFWPGGTGSWAGVPRTVLTAYQRAAARLGVERPGCRLPVALLAGIGKVESDHAEGGAVDSAGTTLRPILGPVLDGSGGNAAIPNTYGTRWAQQGAWARAVGPMQFIPSTWAHWGRGGDPSNVYDAALAAARYLCADGRDLSTPQGLRSAVLSYNDSDVYLSTVLEWMAVYSGQITTVPDSPFMPASGSGTEGPAGSVKSPAPRPSPSGSPKPKPKPSGGSGSTPSPTTPPQPSPSPTPVPGGGLPSLGPVVGGVVGGVTKSVTTTVTMTVTTTVTKTVTTVTGAVGSLLPSP